MTQRIVVGIHEAKTQFSKLVKQAQAGDEIVVESYGKPVARIVRYTSPAQRRTSGFLAGKMWVAPDFDDVPEEFAELLGEQPREA